MLDTFYVHLEFKNKKSNWSINLPFLCARCGVCCVLEDFLTAGEVTVKAQERPEVHVKIKALFSELGKIWEFDHAKYDDYIAHTPCPFLVGKTCSIYDVRPEGCRLFPKTIFGMLTEDCQALIRFKKQSAALKSGTTTEETYHYVISDITKEGIQPSKFTEDQYKQCIAKIVQAGITEEELSLFSQFNTTSKK